MKVNLTCYKIVARKDYPRYRTEASMSEGLAMSEALRIAAQHDDHGHAVKVAKYS